jgi:hypothetical protein
MKWATRPGVHVDRAGCAWLIRRFIDAEAQFVFIDDPADIPGDATGFDMRGVGLGHHGGRCSFETALAQYHLDTDPALEEISHIVHEADLADERYDAPAAAGLDVLIRGLTMTTGSDAATLAITDALFDGLYEHTRRRLLTGRQPT